MALIERVKYATTDKCPYCGSRNFCVRDSRDVGAGREHVFFCRTCERIWREVHDLGGCSIYDDRD
ncbi:MAG: hypothetical protein N3A57_06745 [Negativicutes bacterium]|nr:hypothetical protein [Negativicutes bacterium]